MARIAGVDIPRNKKLNIAIRYIYGIGPTNGAEAISRANVNPETRVRDLTEDEIARLREVVEREYLVEGDLRREVQMNIKRLMDIACYRGLRHRRGMPVRGQRTRTTPAHGVGVRGRPSVLRRRRRSKCVSVGEREEE